MKKITFFIIFLLAGVSYFIFPQDALAQSCPNTTKTYPQYGCDFSSGVAKCKVTNWNTQSYSCYRSTSGSCVADISANGGGCLAFQADAQNPRGTCSITDYFSLQEPCGTGGGGGGGTPAPTIPGSSTPAPVGGGGPLQADCRIVGLEVYPPQSVYSGVTSSVPVRISYEYQNGGLSSIAVYEKDYYHPNWSSPTELGNVVATYPVGAPAGLRDVWQSGSIITSIPITNWAYNGGLNGPVTITAYGVMTDSRTCNGQLTFNVVPAPAPTPHRDICQDGIDNDGDGKTDCTPGAEDPGCFYDANGNPYGFCNPDDNDETDPIVPQCRDGKDNDGDGKIDCTVGAEDPGCFPDGHGGGGACNPNDNDETDVTQCRDGIDNDGDGKTDCTAGAEDPGCFPDGHGNSGACNPNDDNENDVIARCQEIPIYTVTNESASIASNWVRIDNLPASDPRSLFNLEAGDVIYVATSGITTDAQVTKARIRVNSNTWTVADQTPKAGQIPAMKPKDSATDPDRFYIRYVIPTNAYTFKFESEIYSPQFDNDTNPDNSNLGWR